MAGSSSDPLDPNANVAYLVYIPACVFVILNPILMVLRIWARLRRNGKMGADDWTALAAMIFTLLTTGFLVGSCQHGMGHHIKTLVPAEKIEALKFFFMAQVTYKVSINTVKLSIVLLYLKIFNKIRWFKWSCWGLLAVVSIYMVSSVFVTIFQCSPVSGAFNKALEPTCIDNTKFWYANSGFSIATDIVILLLPMHPVYKLHISWAQKVALMAVFTLGIFVVITSCLRITSLDILATTPDTTYDIENVMWTIIEPNVAVVCACLPILRPFIVKLFPKLRSKGSSNYVQSGYGQSGYGSRSRGPQESQNAANRDNWVEIGGAKSDGIHMAGIQRNSSVGSEESILGAQPQSQTLPSDKGRIQKTVEYSIDYSH